MWQKLIRLCGEVMATPTENEEIQFLCIVCAKLKQDPYLVNFFLEVSKSIQNYTGVFPVSHAKSSGELEVSHCASYLSFHSICDFLSCDIRSLTVWNIFFLPKALYIWFSLEFHSGITNTPAQGPFPLQWKCLQSREVNCNVEHCVRQTLAFLLFLSSQRRPRDRLQRALKPCKLLSVLQDWARIW